MEFFDAFYNHCDVDSLAEMERRIADEVLQIAPAFVLVTNITIRDKKRFTPKDILFFNHPSGSNSLKERKPVHFERLMDDLYDYISVRICVDPRYREVAYNRAQEIYEVIENYMKNKTES